MKNKKLCFTSTIIDCPKIIKFEFNVKEFGGSTIKSIICPDNDGFIILRIDGYLDAITFNAYEFLLQTNYGVQLSHNQCYYSFLKLISEDTFVIGFIYC